MPPMLIPALAFIVMVLLVVGLPSLAIVVIRYFKLKERELAIEMEYRHKSQQQGLAIEQRVQGVEQRVQRLEQVLTSLDHDVRDRLEIKSSSATSLSSHAELVEGPAASDADREESLESVPTKVR
jgi:ferritin-like metal-binding protein YciE